MKISELVKPTPDVINEIKASYNRVLKRFQEASRYLDSPDVPEEEKEKRLIVFKVEVVAVLESYIKVLKDWNVGITEDEMIGGFKVE